MSIAGKRATVFAVALAVVVGGAIVFGWPTPGHPTAWADIRPWAGFAVGAIAIAIALVLDGRLRDPEERPPDDNDNESLPIPEPTARVRRTSWRLSMTSSSPPPPDNWRPSHGLTAIESEMLV